MRLHMKLFVLLVLIILLSPAPVVQAQDGPPPMPGLCYGELTIQGKPAPVGTTVTAKVNGEKRGEFVTTEVGLYGGPGLKSKLTVDAENLTSEMARFYVSGTVDGKSFSDAFAGEKAFWGSGEILQIDLAVADIGSAAQPDPPQTADEPEESGQSTEGSGETTAGTDTGSSTGSNTTSNTAESNNSASEASGAEEADEEVDDPGDEEPDEELEAEEEPDSESELAAETVDPGGGETASRAISTGWTVGVGLVLAAALVTLGAGYYIRKKPLKNNINAKH